MAINYKALRGVQDSQKNGNTMFMQASKEITQDTIVRLLPPTAELNGLFYLEQKVYWINNKLLVSPSTFGDYCVIGEYLDQIERNLLEAKNKGVPDNELQDLYDKVKNRKSKFLIPVLHLENIEYDGSKVVNFSVVNDQVRILQCGPQLRNAINEVILSPALLRRLKGVDDLIADRIKGYNISLEKTGKALDTTYTAKQDETCEMPAKYYDKIPSLVRLTKKQTYTDEYLKAALNSYFYGGEEHLDVAPISRYADEFANETKDSEKSNEVIHHKTSSEVITSAGKINKSEQELPKSSSIVDDLDDLDD